MNETDSDLRTRTYIRRISRWTFKYAAPLGTLLGVVYCAGEIFGHTDYIVIEMLCSTGIIAYLLLIMASFALGFCRLHRAFLGYDLVMSLVAKSDTDPVWLYAALGVIGFVLLADMAIRIWIKKGHFNCD